MSDSEVNPTDDDIKDKIPEEDKSNPSVESLDCSFEQSINAREDCLEKGNTEKDAPILEITAVSEAEDYRELLETIEELEPESETEFDNRIETVIEIAQNLIKETQRIGREINTETNENLDPEISSSDEEAQPLPNLPQRNRKSVTFGFKITATPDIRKFLSLNYQRT